MIPPSPPSEPSVTNLSASDLPTATDDPAAPDDPPASPRIPDQASVPGGGPLLPLRNRTYRAFWLASLVSNLGTWVHEVGAGWLMVSLEANPVMVSSVRVAIALPMMVLAIPMGGLADRIERRTLLIVTTAFLLAVTTLLAQLTLSGVMTAWLLLALTFAVGAGMAGHVLGWQATIPELLPREQLSRAIALGSLSFNLARSVGPAFGGILIAVVGTWAAFGFNAVSFACVLLVLLVWRPAPSTKSAPQNFLASIATGIRFCATSSPIRSSLVNLALFVIPASCLWALLPLYVQQSLGWDSRGYGVLVALLGMGAVCAAGGLHGFQVRFGFDRTVAAAMLLFSIAITVLGWWPAPVVAGMTVFAMGVGWMMTLTTLNSTTQANLPSAIRGRGMSLHVTTMSLSMVLGAFVWGRVADRWGVELTYQLAGATVFLAALASFRLRLEADRPAA